MKLLLTSCGLETKVIENQFLSYLDKEVSMVKALFIPTAAVFADAIEVLPKCLNDLLKCGISKDNITVYDLHTKMGMDELKCYDVIYLCGGSPKHLFTCMKEQGFHDVLLEYVRNNGIVIGVSAGSIIFANNMQDNLGFLHLTLDVHCSDDDCEPFGSMSLTGRVRIKLSNNQAIVFEEGNQIRII